MREAAAQPRWTQFAVASIALLIVGVVIGVESPVALLVWLFDGAVALSILLAATLLGVAILDLFCLKPMKLATRLIMGAGLGLGATSYFMLALGLMGWIGPSFRWVSPVALIAGAGVGAWRLLNEKSVENEPSPTPRPPFVLLAIAPFAALIMLVAASPPGFLWIEEGGGYDVLEYHLQLPKEYYQSGSIDYLPHNVYANMPSAAEMLYLFCNQVTGDPIEGWPVAKCLNALMALVMIAGCALAGRQLAPNTASYAALLAASIGWLTYLSGVAYVENGLLLLGVLSLAALLRAARESDPTLCRRWVILAGVLAGLSCGFKYTGLVMVLAPLAAATLVLFSSRVRRRLGIAALFAATGLITLSPWLIKNLVLTGNPVFPLANQYFKANPPGWGPQQTQMFDRGHQPASNEASLTGRVTLLWKNVLADRDQRFGPIVFALPAAAFILRRNRFSAAAALILACQLMVWMFATHLYARFATPLLIVLVPLAASSVASSARSALIAVLVTGVAFNGFMSLRMYNRHLRTSEGERLTLEGAVSIFTEGDMPGFEYVGAINRNVPDAGRVLLVGDARPFYIHPPVDYCVVFNRCTFIDLVENCSSLDEVIHWLRNNRYTHVLVHWGEIARLKSTYGFSEAITITLFDQLEEIGLELIEFVRYRNTNNPYAVLYRVTPP